MLYLRVSFYPISIITFGLANIYYNVFGAELEVKE